MSADIGQWPDDDQADYVDDSPAPRGEEPAQLKYANLVDFVEQHLLPLYRRDVRTWCPQWWKHAEAAVRLDALWMSWEQLRREAGTGSSTWLRDHLDHHMTVLTSDDGPLKGCTPDSGHTDRVIPVLPTNLAPREWGAEG